jgi:hypothetical protein
MQKSYCTYGWEEGENNNDVNSFYIFLRVTLLLSVLKKSLETGTGLDRPF